MLHYFKNLVQAIAGVVVALLGGAPFQSISDRAEEIWQRVKA